MNGDKVWHVWEKESAKDTLEKVVTIIHSDFTNNTEIVAS